MMTLTLSLMLSTINGKSRVDPHNCAYYNIHCPAVKEKWTKLPNRVFFLSHSSMDYLHQSLFSSSISVRDLHGYGQMAMCIIATALHWGQYKEGSLQ